MFLSFKSFCYKISINTEEFVRVGVPSWSHLLFLVFGQVLGMDQEYLSWRGKWNMEQVVGYNSLLMSEGKQQLECKPFDWVPGDPTAQPPSWGKLMASWSKDKSILLDKNIFPTEAASEFLWDLCLWWRVMVPSCSCNFILALWKTIAIPTNKMPTHWSNFTVWMCMFISIAVSRNAALDSVASFLHRDDAQAQLLTRRVLHLCSVPAAVPKCSMCCLLCFFSTPSTNREYWEIQLKK